jgi:hypothetical protein
MPDLNRVFLDLRGRALAAADGGLLRPGDGTLGVVVDIPAQGGYATLVALVDGTTSLYTSSGGGTIGAGAHHRVAVATRTLIETVDAHRASFTDGADDSLPPGGTVRFHGIAAAGGFVADVPEDSFWGRAGHALMPVIAATQELVGAVSSMESE